MELIPGDPFDQKEQGDNRRQKRKSLLSDLREVKKIADNIQKAVKVVRIVASAINPAIWIPVGIFALVFFVIILNNDSTSALSGGGGGGGGSEDGTTSPGGPVVPAIPGFNIDIDGPEEADNGIDLEYTVTITHDATIAPPLTSIEVYDSLPSGATLVSTTGTLKATGTSPNIWPLSEPSNQSGFQITISPNQEDIFFNYSVSARQIASSGTGGSGNTCTEPYEGKGYCTVDSLSSTFGTGDNNALIASMICHGESGSDPFADSTNNLPCPPDYSIGLFQINQLAHCSTAFSSPSTCTIGNQTLLNACVTRFKDPLENINYAHQLFLSGGTGWTVNKWGAYSKVQKKLQECGIL